jgi:CRP-like cAMP-binding protein
VEEIHESGCEQTVSHSLSLFQELLDSHTEFQKSDLEKIVLKDGELLFQRGDRGDALFIIEAGHIQIVTFDQNGTELILNTMSPGEIVGELALLDGKPRSATARAVGDCSLYRLKQESFIKLIYHSSHLDEYLIRLLSARVRYSTEYVLLLGHWVRLIIDGKYDEVIEIIDQQEHGVNRVLEAVSASIRQMVQAVKQREEELRQQVTELTIEIDQEKRQREVEKIAVSPYFQDVLRLAEELRSTELEP